MIGNIVGTIIILGIFVYFGWLYYQSYKFYQSLPSWYNNEEEFHKMVQSKANQIIEEINKEKQSKSIHNLYFGDHNEK